MKRLGWTLLLLGLLGCPSDPEGSGEPDATEADAGHDDAALDAALDGAVDAAPDAADAEPVEMGMVFLDAGGVDATADGALDSGPDGAVDAALDAGPADLSVEDAAPIDMAIAIDASPADMAIDLDAAPDMAPVDMSPPDMAPADMAMPDLAPPDMALPEPDMGPDPLARPPVGFCAPVRPVGWACFGDDRACDGDLTCIDGLCAPRSIREGPCDGSADCVAGQDLYCARYTDEGDLRDRPICRLRTVEGGICHRRNFGCQANLVCVEDTCRQRGGVGSACVTSGDCDLNTWCDVDSRCAEFIALGERCNPRAPGCQPGLICQDEICSERAPPGDGCRNAVDCAVGQYCDRFDDSGGEREEAICVRRLVEGDPCDAREISICSASVCLEGRCVADQPEEGACRSSFDCEAGFWCPR